MLLLTCESRRAWSQPCRVLSYGGKRAVSHSVSKKDGDLLSQVPRVPSIKQAQVTAQPANARSGKRKEGGPLPQESTRTGTPKSVIKTMTTANVLGPYSTRPQAGAGLGLGANPTKENSARPTESPTPKSKADQMTPQERPCRQKINARCTFALFRDF